jgi:hypothetical protein
MKAILIHKSAKFLTMFWRRFFKFFNKLKISYLTYSLNKDGNFKKKKVCALMHS